ncbi:MAG: ATP-binding protein, partial [Acidimicrobiales bacterium]
AAVSRSLLWLGVALQAVAVASDALTTAPVVTAALLGAGALAIGAALAVTSRRSVVGRVAASAGGTLLALVLVLSVALSAVLSSTVRNQAVGQLDIQARALASQVVVSTYGLRPTAVLLSHLVQGHLESTASCRKAPDPCIRSFIPKVTPYYFSDVAVQWVSASGQRLAGGGGSPRTTLRPAVADALARSSAVRQSLAGHPPAPAAEVLGGQLLAVAAWPYTRAGARSPLGTAVVAIPLGTAYLGTQRKQANPSLSLALAGSGTVYARSGDLPPAAALAPLVTSALDGPHAVHRRLGTQFVSVQPVSFGPRATLVLVASTSTAAVVASRNSLFRTLFLIALGGTLLALLLASAVGDSVGAGLRRLTVAADAIRRGETGVRAGLGSGDEVGILGAAFDSMATSIDDKTAALAQAAREEARLRNRLEAVVAGMGEALVAVDAAGRVTNFNHAAEELIGISASSSRGEPLDEMVTLSGEGGEDLSGRLRRPPADRWSEQGWLRGTAGDKPGSAVPVAVTAGEVKGSGAEAVGWVFVIRDLRREREVERMKTEFLSRVGHELRTPLTGIMGFTDLLARADAPPERARVWHGEVLEQSKRLLRTVEMLEFFASAGAGRVQLRRERVNPRSVAEDVVERWSSRVTGAHTIVRRVARDLPPVMGDRRWLTLAVDELVDNAVKFSPDGGRVILRVEPGPDRRSVEISVTDQGKGMSEEEAGRAFADFAQGDSSDTRSYGGLGLGLSLVQRVAEGHGGRVTCESRPGRGSRLGIIIPAGPGPS